MSTTYNHVMLAATDYASVIDSEHKSIVFSRYQMLVNTIRAYNLTCQPCNNSKKLELDGAVGEPFELKFA